MPSLRGKLSVERMCALVQISQAGYYRWLQRKQPGVGKTAVRAAIQEEAGSTIAVMDTGGLRRHFRHCGMVVNRKRVLRMMQEDIPLAIRKRKVVRTTDSLHPFEVFLNLAKRLEARLRFPSRLRFSSTRRNLSRNID